MALISLSLENIRCLSENKLIFSPSFNLFTGMNGSGKTSILEAIHVLGLGRSFRHSYIQSVIQYDQTAFNLYAELKDNHGFLHQLGLQKSLNNKSVIRIDHQPAKNISQVAELMPIQMLHPHSDELVMGASHNRRQFMDWGVFHLTPQFNALWRQGKLILKQRNSLLKSRLSRAELEAWDQAFALINSEISQARRDYIQKLKPYLDNILEAFDRLPPVSLEFQQGWDENGDLREILSQQYYRDSQAGHTSRGSHRDDVQLYSRRHPITDIFSRGEQKLIVIALKLAQGKMLKELTQKSCLFLIDDFSAELDAIHQALVIKKIHEIHSQVFMTSIDLNEIMPGFKDISLEFLKMFHVEQGVISCYK